MIWEGSIHTPPEISVQRHRQQTGAQEAEHDAQFVAQGGHRGVGGVFLHFELRQRWSDGRDRDRVETVETETDREKG